MAKLSIAVVALNEADRIGRLLESVRFADEVVVVDSGSTDGTRQLCEKLGARVVFHPWEGYARQKQFAMDATAHEWILNLDADEVVSDALARELKDAMDGYGTEISAFSMPRLSKYLGRWIKHGGWYPDRKIRLVRRGCGKWEGGLHEKLLTNGKIKNLSAPILHYTYRSVSDHIKTINSFSDAYAAEGGARAGCFVFAGVLHCFGKFLECYLWKLGLLDGIPGLVIAMNSAWYVFVKHAKAWESGLPKGE